MEKFNFTTKLHEACANDPLRPVMMCVHFSGGWALASNGHIAIRQSLEYHSIIDPEHLDGKSLHHESFRDIMSFEFATCTEDGIECKDSDGRSAFFNYFDRKGTEIPNYDSIFKKTSLVSLTFIGFSPENFHKLSKALYAPHGNIRVQFQGVDKAMLVDVIGIDNQEGVLMPVILSDSLF
jgi:hypothetical protein